MFSTQYHKIFQFYRVITLFLFMGFPGCIDMINAQSGAPNTMIPGKVLTEINPPAAPFNVSPLAITGARLIDGTGGSVVENSVVLIDQNRISAVGKKGEVEIPDHAVIYDAGGQTLLPGFIDAHYHSVNNTEALQRILQNGTTAFRDPGHPFRFYQVLDFAVKPMPRAFITGSHLDGFPGVYKDHALLVKDSGHAREMVARYVSQGSSGIKIYFRLPLQYYKPIIQAADFFQVPVFAHLELVDADDAIREGLDGIEHVTSCGTALASPEAAAGFRDTVYKYSNARREWRYRLWADLDLTSERAEKLIELMVSEGTYFSPTLAAFEKQRGDSNAKEYEIRAFRNMIEFVRMAYKAGVKIVTSSHTYSPYAPAGWAFQREMELFAEAGMSPMDIIHSSTLLNAHYFRSESRIGSIEKGKLADLILVDGNPLENISQVKNVKRVMLNGKWLSE